MTVRDEPTEVSRGQSTGSAAIIGAARKVQRVVWKMVDAMERRHRTDKTVQVLARLDDQVLRDIGVSRGSIREAAREMVGYDLRHAPRNR